MGDLIVLEQYFGERSRADRAGAGCARHTAFFFDPWCPFSYLASERVERMLGEVDWVPTPAGALGAGARPNSGRMRVLAETRAAELRLPLVWPDPFRGDAVGALRVALDAAEVGAGARFALAASRLAFCGGFDLHDPEILAEAAAAATMPLDACLLAAGDESRDALLRANAQALYTRGIRSLPAIRVGRRWFEGERQLASAAAVRRSSAADRDPLAPAG